MYCSVGTHPHNAHEELDITTADLVARGAPSEGGGDRRGRARLSLRFSPRDAQEQGFRNHIAAARETGLPLVIHSREADDDMARDPGGGNGEGRLPGRAALLHRRPRSGAARHRARAVDLVHRHPDLQEVRRTARHRRVAAGGPHLGRDRCAVSRARQVSRQAQRAGLCGRDRKGAGRVPRRQLREIARQTTDNFFRLFCKVPRPAAAPRQAAIRASTRHDAAIHHSGLRLFRRRAAAGARLGRLRSEQSEEPPPALFAAGRARARADGVTRILVDTSPDLREQLLDANVEWLDAVLFTHEHADHTHGIDDLRGLFINRRKRVAGLARRARSPQLMHARFGYCFVAPPGSEYPPIVREHRMEAGPADDGRRGRAARSRRCRSCRSTATSPRSASASAVWPIPATSAACRRTASRRSPASTSGSSTRCATSRIRAISASSEALDWIERIKPRRAILTNLHTDLDYEELRSRLPQHVEPAYDGLSDRVARRCEICRHLRRFHGACCDGLSTWAYQNIP